MTEQSDPPSVASLAGQLGYLFEDDPSLRDAPVAQLVARSSTRRTAWPGPSPRTRTAATPRSTGHLAEFHDRIGAVEVEQARQQVARPRRDDSAAMGCPFAEIAHQKSAADFGYTVWVR